MDTAVLVEKLIKDGRLLVDKLLKSGFNLIAAFWIKPVDDERWYLYLISGSVDQIGLKAAYSAVGEQLQSIPDCWISPTQIKLIDERNKIALDVVRFLNLFPGRRPNPLLLNSVGSISIDEFHLLYPDFETPWPRQAFEVIYRRNDADSRWTSEVQPRQIYSNIRFEGAVSYSSGLWNGDLNAEAENYASVTVMIAIDPKIVGTSIMDRPEFQSMLKEQVRKTADELFKSKHPEAEIVPVDDHTY